MSKKNFKLIIGLCRVVTKVYSELIEIQPLNGLKQPSYYARFASLEKRSHNS